MIRLLWAISPVIRDFLARWMPTNRLLAAIRTRRGLKWGVPAMGIGVLYWIAAASLTAVIRDGDPAWLNALVLLVHLERDEVHLDWPCQPCRAHQDQILWEAQCGLTVGG